MKGVVFLLKDNIPGKVKTRLGHEIGMKKASKIHACLSHWTVKTALKKNTVYISFSGDLSGDFAESLRKEGAELFTQPAGDLGYKIYHAITKEDRCVVLGGDCPLVSTEDISIAMNASDLVIGPAEDGGYWLIAANSPTETLFKDIKWSSGSVFRRTVEIAKEQMLPYSLLSTRYDIDTHSDLQKLFNDPSCPTILKKKLYQCLK